jgi:hypothetical protein
VHGDPALGSFVRLEKTASAHLTVREVFSMPSLLQVCIVSDLPAHSSAAWTLGQAGAKWPLPARGQHQPCWRKTSSGRTRSARLLAARPARIESAIAPSTATKQACHDGGVERSSSWLARNAVSK